MTGEDHELSVEADRLAEVDPARAELVHVQLALAARGIATVEALIRSEVDAEAYAEAAALLRRQNVLIAHHGRRWTRELAGETANAARVVFRRGRLVGLACDPDDVDAIGRALERAPALCELTFDAAPNDAAAIDAIAALPDIHRITSLRAPDDVSLGALVRALPGLARLSGGTVEGGDLAACAALERLATNVADEDFDAVLPALARATHLEIGDAPDRMLSGRFSRAVRIATGVPSGPPSTLPPELALAVDAASVGRLAALLAAPAFASVRSLAVTTVEVDNGPNESDATPVADAAIAILARGVRSTTLAALEIACDDGADGSALVDLATPQLARFVCVARLSAEVLADLIDRLPRLSAVRAGDVGGDAGEILAVRPSLARLRELAATGMTDAGVRALGRSPHVHALRRLGVVRGGHRPFRRRRLPDPAAPGSDAYAALSVPALVALEVSDIDPQVVSAPHANLVELRATYPEQLARLRVRARLGAGAIGATAGPTSRELVAISDGDPDAVAALFAELAPRAVARGDDGPHTLLRVSVPGGGELQVVSCVDDFVRLAYRATDRIARAAAVGICARVGGTLFVEERT